jgi:hypothetical protein
MIGKSVLTGVLCINCNILLRHFYIAQAITASLKDCTVMFGRILNVVHHIIFCSTVVSHPSGFLNDLVGFALTVSAYSSTVVTSLSCVDLVLKECIQELKLIGSHGNKFVLRS